MIVDDVLPEDELIFLCLPAGWIVSPLEPQPVPGAILYAAGLQPPLWLGAQSPLPASVRRHLSPA